MPFALGDLVVFSVTRYAGEIISGDAVNGWRSLSLSHNPAEMPLFFDAQENVTVFRTNVAVPTPAGKPPPQTIVRVAADPLAFTGGAPAVFNTLPVEETFQVAGYVNLGGFGVYALLYARDGAVYVALPSELAVG